VIYCMIYFGVVWGWMEGVAVAPDRTRATSSLRVAGSGGGAAVIGHESEPGLW